MCKSVFIPILSFGFNDLITCAGKRIGSCIRVAGTLERPHHDTRQSDGQVLQYAAEYKNEQKLLNIIHKLFYRIFFSLYYYTFLAFNV